MTAMGIVGRPVVRRASRRNGPGWGNPVVYFIALCFIALMMAPVVYQVIGGFRDGSQITVDPAGWPNPWRISAYQSVLTNGMFWRALLNSVIAAVATTAGVVALGLYAVVTPLRASAVHPHPTFEATPPRG